jgi:sortase family protein
MSERRLRFAVVGAALGLALLAGCATNPTSEEPRPATSPGATEAQVTAPQVVEPAEITLPALDAHSTLVGLGLNDDGTVEVPPVTEPMQAGWFAGGPKPGEPGPAVILGHVNGGGHPGIFARLRELQPGDQVLVGSTDGSTKTFTVRKVDQTAKSRFPTDAVYGDTAGPELRLITCGGEFDTSAHSYRDNVIVYATLT